MSESFDVIVIGSGPGGYVCAIRCAQLGLKTACVEKDATLGGTCLNVGCIPSKALLHVSHEYHTARHGFDALGIEIGTPTINVPKMMQHKDKVVKANTQGIDYLFRKNKITRLVGHGTITAPGQVTVGDQVVQAKNIVIATGSTPASLPGITIDEQTIVTSTGALSFDKVPKSLVVIGGGVIGLEMGIVWQRLGTEVTVVEYLDRLLPGMDDDLAKEAKKIFGKKGIKFILGSKVTSATAQDNHVTLHVEPAAGGDAQTLDAEKVLVAIGRRPYTEGLGLENVGVRLDERGRVEIDDHFKTSADGIYAIGDVVRGAMLAHKAEDEGVALAEILAGKYGHVNYDAVPGVVYTYPEIASVGKTEAELKADGITYNVGKFPYMANGRARAMNETDGFVKILADKVTDKILGCHIIGAEAGTLIAEVGLAMEFGASTEDIALTCHAHPTLNEVVKEAALAALGREIHM